MFSTSATVVLLLAVTAAAASAKDCHTKKSGSKLLCYYGKARDVNSCKCSHVILPAHADLKSIESLRDKLSNTKLLLTVNEFNEGLVNTLKSSKVDGLEIDLKKLDSKNDISDFVSTVRSKLGSDLYLALSVPAKTETLAKYYDFKALSKNVDVFVLQTHFLGVSKNVTFHPSRLSGLWDVQNTDSVVDLVSGLGAPLSKLVISAPVQGFKFTLQNEEHTAPGSPAVELSTLTRDQLCDTMSNDKWMLERDQDQAGPYIFRAKEWVSFEDPTSMDIKAKYSRVRGLAGLALKDLSQDGGSKCGGSLLEAAFTGLSKQARAPRGAVLHSLEREILETPARTLDNVQISPYRISRVIDTEGHVHVVRQDTRTEFECTRQGYFVHPRSCGRFYRCVKFDQLSDEFSVFEFDCPAGLAFDNRVEVCVWPGSLPDASACSGSSEIAPVPRERFICPGEPGYYADPENCRWFFACLDHGKSPLSAYEFRCPYGLVYDQERLLCEWPWLVPKCGSGLAGGNLHVDEYYYGGEGHEARSNDYQLDQYNGLGSLNGIKLGGLSGPLEQPISKTYSSVGVGDGAILGVGLGSGFQHSVAAGVGIDDGLGAGLNLVGQSNSLSSGYNNGILDGGFGSHGANIGYEGYSHGASNSGLDAASGYNHGAALSGANVGFEGGLGSSYSQGSSSLNSGLDAASGYNQGAALSGANVGYEGSLSSHGLGSSYSHGAGSSSSNSGLGASGYNHGASLTGANVGYEGSSSGHGLGSSYSHGTGSSSSSGLDLNNGYAHSQESGSRGSGYAHSVGGGALAGGVIIGSNAGYADGSHSLGTSYSHGTGSSLSSGIGLKGGFAHSQSIAHGQGSGLVSGSAYNSAGQSNQAGYTQGSDFGLGGGYAHNQASGLALDSGYNSAGQSGSFISNGAYNHDGSSGSYAHGSEATFGSDSGYNQGFEANSGFGSKINVGTFGQGNFEAKSNSNENFKVGAAFFNNGAYANLNEDSSEEQGNNKQTLQHINIVAGGSSGVVPGVQILQHGVNLGSAEHVTPISVFASTIPSVTSVPIPTSTQFGLYGGGVVANIPDLQYKLEHPTTINAHLSGLSNITYVSSTQSPLVVKAEGVYDNLNYQGNYKQADFAGYDYSKPSIKFDYPSSTPQTYLPPKKTAFVQQTQKTYVQPLKPVQYSFEKPVFYKKEQVKPVIAYDVKPVAPIQGYHYDKPSIVFEEQKVLHGLPVKTTVEKVQPLSIATVQPVYQEVKHYQKQGYRYEKPAVVFEEHKKPALAYQEVVSVQKPAVVFEEHRVQAPVVAYQDKVEKHQGYNYDKPSVAFVEGKEVQPAITYQEIKHHVHPTVAYQEHQVQPAVTYQEHHVKPAVTYQEQYVQPAVTYQEHHVQPAVTYQEHHVKPAVAYQEHHVQPAVTYQEIKHQVQPTVAVQPAVAYQEVNVQPAYTYQEIKHQPTVAVEKHEGYNYEKPAIAFEEVRKPAVTYQEVKHHVQPAVTYQEVKHQTVAVQPAYQEQPLTIQKHEGYTYEKPAIAFEEAPKAVTYQEVNAVVQHQVQPLYQNKPAVIQPTVAYQEVKPAVTYQEVKPAVTYHEVKPAVIYQEVKPAVTYQEVKPAVAYQEVKPAVAYQEVKPAVAYQEIQHHVQPTVSVVKNEGYHYEKPAVVFEEHKQPATYQEVKHHVQPALTYQEVLQKPAIQIKHEVQPAVAYQEVNHHVAPTYQYEKPAVVQPAIYQEVKHHVQPTVAYEEHRVQPYQEVKHVQPAVAVEKHEGYSYEKPAIAFEEVPRPAVTYQHHEVKQPAVAYQEINVHKPAVNIQEINHEISYQKPEVIQQHIQPAVTYQYSSGYHYEKPKVAFEDKKVVHTQHYPEIKLQHTQEYYEKPAVQSYQQPIVEKVEKQIGYVYEKPTVAFEETPYAYQKPAVAYQEVKGYHYNKPAVKFEEIPTAQTLKPLKQAYEEVQHYAYQQPALTYQQVQQPVVAYQETVTKPALTYHEVKQPVIQYHHEVQKEVKPSYKEILTQPSKATIISSFSINQDNGYKYEPAQTYLPVPTATAALPQPTPTYIPIPTTEKYNYNNPYESDDVIEEELIVPKKAFITYENKGYDYPKPNVKFEEVPVLSTPRPTYSSTVATIINKGLVEDEYYYDNRFGQKSTPEYIAIETPASEAPVKQSRPIVRYEFSSFDAKYNPPAPTYLPVTTQRPTKRIYVPSTTPKRIYLPATTTEHYVEITTPSKEYLPVTQKVYRVKTPRPTTPKPARVYLPVSTEAPTREYLPVTTRTRIVIPIPEKPNREYLPVSTEKPSREYLPVTRKYVPSKVQQEETYVVEDTYLSTRRPRVKVTKSKSIIKVNDFHPILSAKLGAQCTCVSNTLTLRKKQKSLNYPETEVTPIIVEDNNYENKGDVIVEEYNYEPNKISSSTLVPLLEERVSKPVDVFVKTRRPSVTVIQEDDKPSGKEIAAAINTGLKLVKSAAKEGVKEALATRDFDRYGPGGVRSRDETLQGTTDCQRAGLFRHPKHCNKFYTCRWDCTKKKFTLHVFNCPVYLTFDNNLGACNWPSQGPACVDNTLLPSD